MAGFLTDEQRKTMSTVFQGRSPLTEAATLAKPVANHIHKSNGSSGETKGLSVGHGLEPKRERRSHSGKNGRPKKAGNGGKGTWGALLDHNQRIYVDRNDPNYDSEEEPYKLVAAPVAQSLEEYKEKIQSLVEEYFSTGDVSGTAMDLQNLGSPQYHHYFVKKLISIALDRHDREKEMSAILLSALYADVVQPDQLAKGFSKLLESVDDLALDIPDAVDILAVFLARAVVDDILSPAFLYKSLNVLPEGSQGISVIHRAERTYLAAPHHAELVERKWGGSTQITVAEVQAKVVALLKEYVDSGDKAEACRCIRELNMPFFHHEVVKRALILAMEQITAEVKIWELLQECSEEGLITSSQMAKGFSRLLEQADDLTLDIPHAKDMLESLTIRAKKEGWVSTPYTRALSLTPEVVGHAQETRTLKQKARTIIQEFFLSGDIGEVVRSLQDLGAPDFLATFLKILVTLAMDRKNREKEMTSVLISALYAEVIPVEDIAKAFTLLLYSVEDTALDIPDAANELAKFLARAVVDDILAPFYLDGINEQLEQGSMGREIVHMVQSALSARHASERILRCWGSSGTGQAVEDAKENIQLLLEEYYAGGELAEACQCIRDLDMPFFHHEIVKKALIMAMEKQNNHILSLLAECAKEGLITTSQMVKGFTRVIDSLDDLSLDIPDASNKMNMYVEEAKAAGWLSPSFSMSAISNNGTQGRKSP